MRRLGRPVNDALVRLVGSEPLVLRVDLDDRRTRYRRHQGALRAGEPCHGPSLRALVRVSQTCQIEGITTPRMSPPSVT